MIRSSEGDWREVEERIKGAYDLGLNELPMGELVVKIGLTFLGTPYAPVSYTHLTLRTILVV